MQESWNDTNDLNDTLGDDFDVTAGWEDFNNKKEKERPIPFWFWGILSLLGLAIIVCLFKNQDKQEISQPISTESSLTLNSSANPSFAHSPTTKYLKEKDLSTNKVADTPFSNVSKGSNMPKKAQGNSLFGNNVIAIEKNKLQPKIDQQYILSNRDKSIIRNNSKVQFPEESNTKVVFEKTTPYSLKSFSRKDPINYLSSPIPPLTVEPPAIISLWDNLPNFPTVPLTDGKFRTFSLAYTFNSPKRVIIQQDELYQNLRQNGEQFLEQQQVDFTFIQSIDNTFFLSTGLSYGRYRSRLVEKIQTLQSPVVYNNVIIETQTQNSIINEIRGEAIGSQLSINQSTRYQVYQTLAIPIQIGMLVPLKQDWQLSLGTGIALNLWQHTKGKTYASTRPNGEFTSVAALGYRTAGTLETISTFQIQKRITKQLSLQLGLQAKFDLNNRIKKELGVSDKWKSYGLSIGISRTW